MGLQKGKAINRLYGLLQEGAVASSAWLAKQGYSRQLLRKYVQSGWLVSVSRGAFRRPESEPEWPAIVSSLEKYWGLSCHAGGRTALDLRGYAHSLALGKNKPVHLYAQSNLPAWLRSLSQPKLVFHTSSMFGPNADDTGLEEMKMDGGRFSVQISRSERAMLELLSDVPDRESFEEADKLMEGLANLSPSRVMGLLLACKNIKAKRLFLWLADRHGHAWFQKLDTDKVNLGSGKRMLVKGGRLVSRYQITVPAEMIDGSEQYLL